MKHLRRLILFVAILVSSEVAPSPSGAGIGWNCTYRTINGNLVTIWLPTICPPTMDMP